MAAQAVSKLCLEWLVGGVALTPKCVFWGDLGSVNETRDWKTKGGVVSFWGETSTREESWAISAGASEFSYNASTPTDHALISSHWSFIFC